jgi:predicted PurR-regulated permease PerM
MNQNVTMQVLFVILLVGVLGVALQVIAPFVAGFTWAAVLVAAFRPFHQRLERAFGGRQWAATTVVTLLVAGFVVVPLVAAAVQAVQAGIAAVHWIQTSYQSGGSDLGLGDRWPWIGEAIGRGKELVGLANVDLKATAISGLTKLGSLVATSGPGLVGGAFGLAFSFAIMLVGMPVFFANGPRLMLAAAESLPIPTAEATRILDDLTLMTRSVFMSVGVTAAAQAALGGIALLVLGVPHAGALTAVMFFCALLPGGTAVVWAPAAIWLAATDHAAKAIILAVWGAGVVSTIDNVLRPLLAGKGVKLPGMALFLGMFGGMIAFGIVGLFLGPIALYMARELVEILRRDIYEPPPGQPPR